MAIISRKISSFPQLPTLSGEEFLAVAYKGKTYKIPVKMLTGNAIQEISQKINSGDGASSPITLKVGSGEEAQIYTFYVFNGQRGSQGPDGNVGKKGPKGDTGIALHNIDPSDIIYDSLDEDVEKELSEYILSAKQGKILNDKLEALREVYLEQEEYDELVERGEIEENVKYFIWEN